MASPLLTRRTALALILAAPVARATPRSAHAFAFPALEGGEIRLADFAGKAVLVVNTASFCAFTPQYEGLQALHDRYAPRGFAVLGVPSQDFRQEHDSAAEVKAFCTLTYGITFPMTDILSVRGPSAHPFFRWAAETGGRDYVPGWNFHKLLVGPDGQLAGAFGTSTPPGARRLRDAVEAALPRAQG